MSYPCSGKNYRTARVSDSKNALMMLLCGTDGGILLMVHQCVGCGVLLQAALGYVFSPVHSYSECPEESLHLAGGKKDFAVRLTHDLP